MADSPNQAAARQVLQDFIRERRAIVAAMYEVYRRNVMPPDAPAIQVLECKRAFFAGARSLLDLLMAAADAGDEITARDEEIMAAIDAELADYIIQEQVNALNARGGQ